MSVDIVGNRDTFWPVTVSLWVLTVLVCKMLTLGEAGKTTHSPSLHLYFQPLVNLLQNIKLKLLAVMHELMIQPNAWNYMHVIKHYYKAPAVGREVEKASASEPKPG